MTESFVTQCPHCRTSFRVNQAQLGAAHGAVRCGACLHVFNAAQQLRDQGHVLPVAAPAKTPSAAPAQPTQTSAPASAPPLDRRHGQGPRRRYPVDS
ncbi:zinc-ribbon domain-containing protein [Pseudomonas lalucatii]|nr:zinc-ribbon domain-containing protein [Pseudomonas lalucatii]